MDTRGIGRKPLMGKRLKFDEMRLHLVKNGKIVPEERFYDMV